MPKMPTSLTPAQTEAAVSVIYKARTDNAVKLRFGFRKRQALSDAFAANTLDREDYRYKWLKHTRNQVVEFLKARSDEFNAAHPYDRISLHDFIDVADSLAALLRGQLGEE